MKNPVGDERRGFERFDTEVKVYFHVHYNIKTIVKFRVVKKETAKVKKHLAFSRNVSIEGMSFISGMELSIGDALSLELYLPSQKEPILMKGEVRWCRPLAGVSAPKKRFETGIKLLEVNGVTVAASIHYDRENRVYWSAVLESVFGSFRKLAQKSHLT